MDFQTKVGNNEEVKTTENESICIRCQTSLPFDSEECPVCLQDYLYIEEKIQEKLIYRILFEMVKFYHRIIYLPFLEKLQERQKNAIQWEQKKKGMIRRSLDTLFWGAAKRRKLKNQAILSMDLEYIPNEYDLMLVFLGRYGRKVNAEGKMEWTEEEKEKLRGETKKMIINYSVTFGILSIVYLVITQLL